MSRNPNDCEPVTVTNAQALERIIARMQEIQRAIKVSRQPASMLELEELKELGREYARIVDRLANDSGDTGLA